MRTPSSYFYSTKHLWAKPIGDGNWQAGVTDYAQDLLGDIVFIDAPAVGATLVADTPCGVIESVKTGSDLHALVDGEVIAINTAVINTPEQVNDDPYLAWIFTFRPSNQNVEQTLLSAADYEALIQTL